MTFQGSSDHPDRIRALFDEVVGLGPEARTAYLAEACREDEELRREVESLLDAADARGSGVRRALEGLQPSERSGGKRSAPPEPGDVPTSLQTALADRYRIVRELGRGGMATVYLADDVKHHRQVAVKVLRPELAAVVGAKRFLAEIETTANLQHPHILPLFDSGETDGVLFYVMPYVEGESLRQKLDQERQLAVPDAVAIATKVSSALNYAHRHGVIHRDIKPANILLHDGEPVVTDFGIALAVSRGSEDRLTETGLSLGTPHYMSPEQATGDHYVGPATDVYALGCVLYEMLAGEPPYRGSTPQAVLGKIITGGAEPVSGQRASVPPNVEAAITRALEKIPADRFATTRRFAEALRDPAFRHSTEGQAGSSAASARRRGLERSAWAAMLFVAVVLGAWGWLRPDHTHDVVRLPVALPIAGGPSAGPSGFPQMGNGWPTSVRPTRVSTACGTEIWTCFSRPPSKHRAL
jgi:serine/threonine-protein kinase